MYLYNNWKKKMSERDIGEWISAMANLVSYREIWEEAEKNGK